MLLVLCALSYTCLGQGTDSGASQQGVKKNTIHAGVGSVGLIAGYNVNYERLIVPIKMGQLWARATAGGWAIWTSSGPYQATSLVLLTGLRSNHFELHAGMSRMLDRQSYEDAQDMSRHFSEPLPSKSSYTYFRAVGGIGYRYQKPSGRFIFRTGVAYPETVYLGLGVAL